VVESPGNPHAYPPIGAAGVSRVDHQLEAQIGSFGVLRIARSWLD